MKLFELEENQGLDFSPFEPDLTFSASDEYNTRVSIRLPSKQTMLLLITPDYVDNPKIYYRLKEVLDDT